MDKTRRSSLSTKRAGVILLLLLFSFPFSPWMAKAQSSVETPRLMTTAMLGTNVIINGDAESGVGTTDGSYVSSPGWGNIQNYATVVQYGSPGGFPGQSSPGPTHRGVNFFAGGPDVNGVDYSVLFQTIDVTAFQSLIDAGSLGYHLGGWFGGFSSQTDWSGLIIYFLVTPTDLPGIGSKQVGPVTAAERSDTTGLYYRSANGVIPPGTRYILVNLDFNRFSPPGTYNDGYADQIELVIGSRVFLPAVLR